MGHPRRSLSRCYDWLCRLQVERLCLTIQPSLSTAAICAARPTHSCIAWGSVQLFRGIEFFTPTYQGTNAVCGSRHRHVEFFNRQCCRHNKFLHKHATTGNPAAGVVAQGWNG